MAGYVIAAVVIVYVTIGPYLHWRQKRRRAARGPFVPLAPGAVPTGKNRGPRFRMLVEVEGYDDRANEGLVERDVRAALCSGTASGGVFYDVSSVEVSGCRQVPADEERSSGATAPVA